MGKNVNVLRIGGVGEEGKRIGEMPENTPSLEKIEFVSHKNEEM